MNKLGVDSCGVNITTHKARGLQFPPEALPCRGRQVSGFVRSSLPAACWLSAPHKTGNRACSMTVDDREPSMVTSEVKMRCLGLEVRCMKVPWASLF